MDLLRSYSRDFSLFLGLLSIFVLASCGPSRQVQKKEPSKPLSPTDSEPKKPYIRPIDSPFTFDRAVQKGTRTRSGRPGPNYWQQWAEYDLEARLFPDERRLEGQGTIIYHNNSPDTLNRLLMELVQNVHVKGTIRNQKMPVTGGIQIKKLTVNGISLHADSQKVPNYKINATRLILDPKRPLPPGDSTRIQVKWSFEIPSKGAGGRMGYDKHNLYYIGYWYPVMSVYDDVNGWFTSPFRGRAEFYFGYGNYDLEITAPQQWVIMSTGKLQNAGKVLASDVLKRYRKAAKSDSVIHVIQREDFGNATKTNPDSLLTWHFKADSVRDVAFSATTQSLWDAARAPVGDRDGDGDTDYTRTDAFYRTDAKLWTDAVSHLQHSISFLSKYTGYAYPWSHITAVEGDGIIGGGMEYPMMTVIGPYHGRSSSDLYGVIAHELAHMWMPMIVGTNERRYSWMDEGTTTFNENVARADRYPRPNHWKDNRRAYRRIAGTGYEGEIMRWSDFHINRYTFTIASYYKPAILLYSLREILGEETFQKAYRELFDRWAYKHPQPWDFFNTFEDVSGRELDWFWRSWYYETWVLDQAVSNVVKSGEVTQIKIKNAGTAIMPVPVKITFKNGNTTTRNIEARVWKNGNSKTTVTIKKDSPVTKVEIDPKGNYPDVNRRNNMWRKN